MEGQRWGRRRRLRASELTSGSERAWATEGGGSSILQSGCVEGGRRGIASRGEGVRGWRVTMWETLYSGMAWLVLWGWVERRVNRGRARGRGRGGGLAGVLVLVTMVGVVRGMDEGDGDEWMREATRVMGVMLGTARAVVEGCREGSGRGGGEVRGRGVDDEGGGGASEVEKEGGSGVEGEEGLEEEGRDEAERGVCEERESEEEGGMVRDYQRMYEELEGLHGRCVGRGYGGGGMEQPEGYTDWGPEEGEEEVGGVDGGGEMALTSWRGARVWRGRTSRVTEEGVKEGGADGRGRRWKKEGKKERRRVRMVRVRRCKMWRRDGRMKGTTRRMITGGMSFRERVVGGAGCSPS